MADPSEAEVRTMLVNAIHTFEELREFGESDGTNLVGLLDTFRQSIEGDYVGAADGVLDGLRVGFSGLLARAEGAITPILREYVKVINDTKVFATPAVLVSTIYEHFRDNSITIKSRTFTFGTPTADGSNIGDGQLLRLTKDENNFDIENQFADAKRATCVSDQNTGAQKHNEVFLFEGGDPGRDQVKIDGSGASKLISSVSKADSLLSNPSFDTLALGAATTTEGIPNWTAGAVSENTTNFTELTGAANVYHEAIDDFETPKGLQFNVAATLAQKLSINRTALDVNTPYMLQVAWNRSINSAAGTLTLHFGTQSESVAVSAQSGWQVLRMPITQNVWYRNLEENDLDIQIQWVPDSGSEQLVIDDVILVPYTQFDGSYYVVVGGTTPWLAGTPILDRWTWTDTEVGAVVQVWLWRTYNQYWPHAATPTIADP